MAQRGRKPGCAKTPGSGRKRGVRNRASVAREAEIKASGLDPLSHMLNILRNEKETPVDASAALAERRVLGDRLRSNQGPSGWKTFAVVGRDTCGRVPADSLLFDMFVSPIAIADRSSTKL